MDKVYNHQDVEGKNYKKWEDEGHFKPEINPKGKPYSIILPPTNANGSLHFGHAMYVVEDILIRFHRMKGFSTLWLPGTDHAGIETQFVFEKKLRAEGKSRLDFTREELYEMIKVYVDENRGGIEQQLKRLGFSLDWSSEKYTLDKDIVAIVYDTFKKLFDDKLAYRAKRLVNYCTFDGTSFSDLEVIYEERQSKLYFVKYPIANEDKYITVATTRPETMFGDTAVAVNPKDKRYKDFVGKKIDLPLTNKQISIISDDSIDMDFGTGAVKITPAHDTNDYEVGQKHSLDQVTVVGFDGKMTKDANEFEGLYIKQARTKVVEKLLELGFLEKEENITHQVPVCYKCKNPIEPLLLEQWFIQMKPLAKKAKEAVEKGIINIYPNSFKKIYFQILENYKDWNISRQIVWGIKIPAFKCEKCGNWEVTTGEVREKCGKCSGKMIQDSDTFDTWFSSGQWPYATLKSTNNLKFYPVNVMETGYDILRAWVARMVMLGIFIQEKQGIKTMEEQVPFKDIVLHGLVNDPLGKKMSKSKGNVVNPIELADQYGADSVRFALVYGTAFGNDQALSYPKLEAARKFTNKLWNMARFIEMSRPQSSMLGNESDSDKEMIKKIEKLSSEVTRLLDKYDFNHAAQYLYDFIWHEFADVYIEDVKTRINKDSFKILLNSYLTMLKLLHPFMPFVTEEIYQRLFKDEAEKTPLIISSWPV